MALLTLEGIYRDGKVELAEAPSKIDGEMRVLVTFLPAARLAPPHGAGEAEGPSREELRQRAFARMESGLPLGGGPYYASRDELYERRNRSR